MANSNFKLPLATEIARDNASSTGSRLEQRSFRCRNQLESRHLVQSESDTCCNNSDNGTDKLT
jgi:hypothetical protein